jgi:hypothetical protein
LIPASRANIGLRDLFDEAVQRTGCTRIMLLQLASAAGRRGVMETQNFVIDTMESSCQISILMQHRRVSNT